MATKIYKNPFAATGDRQAIPETDQPDGKMSQAAGWTPDYEIEDRDDPNYKPVGRKEMNGVFYEVSQALGEMQQYGFALWQSVTGGWPKDARVQKDGLVWRSLSASNTTVPGASGAQWTLETIEDASTTKKGIVRLATPAETAALTAADIAVTPQGLASAIPNYYPYMAKAATFTRATNTITMVGIAAGLGLQIGDVIRVTGSTNNNKIFTVFSVPTADSILVNTPHANGVGPLSLVNETGANVTIQRLAKWFNAPLGMGQDWVKVNRVENAYYVNNLNRSIMASIRAIQFTSGGGVLIVRMRSIDGIDGRDFLKPSGGNSGTGLSIEAFVPYGTAFSYSTVGTTGSNLFYELC